MQKPVNSVEYLLMKIFVRTSFFFDLSGKCDPYCKLAILAKRHINAKVIQKGNISDWVVEGIVEEESIKQSTSKVSTMEPEWEEVFELYVFILSIIKLMFHMYNYGLHIQDIAN